MGVGCLRGNNPPPYKAQLWGCGRFLGVVSYTASPWLVLYSTGLFQPSDCLILEWLYQWMYSPARSMTSSHVRSSQCPEMHGLDLHTAEEPLGRGVVRAAPLRAHGPDQAVPAHPFQPSRPPVAASAVAVRPRDARRHAAWRRPGPGIVSRRFGVLIWPGFCSAFHLTRWEMMESCPRARDTRMSSRRRPSGC